MQCWIQEQCKRDWHVTCDGVGAGICSTVFISLQRLAGTSRKLSALLADPEKGSELWGTITIREEGIARVDRLTDMVPWLVRRGAGEQCSKDPRNILTCHCRCHRCSHLTFMHGAARRGFRKTGCQDLPCLRRHSDHGAALSRAQTISHRP